MSNADIATTIIQVAKEHGFYDDPLPEGDEERISEATAIHDEAKLAHERGARGKAIVAILSIGSLEEEVEKEFIPDIPEVFVPSIPDEPKDVSVPPLTFNTQVEAKELAIARIKKERLPIPSEIEGEPPTLPRDISVLSDSDLRRLHSEYNACLARSNWLVALGEADELAARQIADFYHAKAVKVAGSVADPVTGKAKTVAALEAEAAGDDDAREWRQLATKHFIDTKLLKALRDTYQSNCDRISREYSMREGERK